MDLSGEPVAEAVGRQLITSASISVTICVHEALRRRRVSTASPHLPSSPSGGNYSPTWTCSCRFLPAVRHRHATPAARAVVVVWCVRLHRCRDRAADQSGACPQPKPIAGAWSRLCESAPSNQPLASCDSAVTSWRPTRVGGQMTAHGVFAGVRVVPDGPAAQRDKS